MASPSSPPPPAPVCVPSCGALEADATPDGLWLTSTADEDLGKPNRFRVRASGVWRDAWSSGPESLRLRSNDSTHLSSRGEVRVTKDSASYIRRGLVEEYRVSTDGVRQDFLVLERPSGFGGGLNVSLEVTGARAETADYGVKLNVTATGRELAYSRLVVTDATGRPLKASMKVDGSDRLRIEVEDELAVYPVRIDPTFSDADWIGMGGGSIGANSDIAAMTVDGSDNLIVAGYFTSIGDVQATRIAKWNGSTWSAMGSGMDTSVRALAVMGTDVYAAGGFSSAGGVSASRIARWNGTAWVALGTGLNGDALALTVSGTDLYVGGAFSTAGGLTANRIAKWDGAALVRADHGNEWECQCAGGDERQPVRGWRLHHGGRFVHLANRAMDRHLVGRRDDETNGSVFALASGPNILYVGGSFSTAGEFGQQRGLLEWKFVGQHGIGHEQLGDLVRRVSDRHRVRRRNFYHGGRYRGDTRGPVVVGRGEPLVVGAGHRRGRLGAGARVRGQ